jgi:6-pyruvoyltetrahydropterin/6-carboxytetrahydropterin synthase
MIRGLGISDFPDMRARLTKEFRFEAAHTLPSLPEDHKCRQMHGHSFKVEISIEGVVDETIGWVYDHKRITDAMKPLLDRMDHSYLNDIEGLESPTIERMAAWFWKKLAPDLPGLAEIVIFETPTARCSFKGLPAAHTKPSRGSRDSRERSFTMPPAATT